MTDTGIERARQCNSSSFLGSFVISPFSCCCCLCCCVPHEKKEQSLKHWREHNKLNFEQTFLVQTTEINVQDDDKNASGRCSSYLEVIIASEETRKAQPATISLKDHRVRRRVACPSVEVVRLQLEFQIENGSQKVILYRTFHPYAATTTGSLSPVRTIVLQYRHYH